MPLTKAQTSRLAQNFQTIYEMQTTAALLAVAQRTNPEVFLGVFAELKGLNVKTKMLPQDWFSHENAHTIFTEGREMLAEAQDQVRAKVRKNLNDSMISGAITDERLDNFNKRLRNLRRSTRG